MATYSRFFIVLALCFLSASCTIVKTVNPAPAGKTIDKIYVAQNRNVHMEGLHPEIIAQLRSLGFQAESYDGVPPPTAVYTLIYTANWNWDMAMYMTYFQATLLENGKVLGRAEYDSRRGGARMDKFGRTAEKIRPLLIDLLGNVDRAKPQASLGNR
jgi:hypothetical protein